MKILFFIMCMVCAVSLSMISMIYKMGRIPFREMEPSATAAAPVQEQPQMQALSVFSDSGKAVQELVEALNKERETYRAKLADLAVREEELRLQADVLGRFKVELKDLQAQLDANIYVMLDAEKSNLRRIADVTGKMDPAGAATSLLEMEKERAAMILSLMNERQAAAILDATIAQDAKGAEKVAQWTDIIRKMASTSAKTKTGGG